MPKLWECRPSGNSTNKLSGPNAACRRDWRDQFPRDRALRYWFHNRSVLEDIMKFTCVGTTLLVAVVGSKTALIRVVLPDSSDP